MVSASLSRAHALTCVADAAPTPDAMAPRSTTADAPPLFCCCEFVDRHGARRHLSDVYGIGVELVVPVQQIPRTTSGKVQRAQLARELLAGAFDEALEALSPASRDGEGTAAVSAAAVSAAAENAAAETAPADAAASTPEDMEAMMCAFCDQVLDGLRFGPEDNLFEQGMSSIDLAEIHGLIEARFPGGLDIRDFFDQPTIRGLAAVLAERVRSGKVSAG